jgi:hypothetical protein
VLGLGPGSLLRWFWEYRLQQLQELYSLLHIAVVLLQVCCGQS